MDYLIMVCLERKKNLQIINNVENLFWDISKVKIPFKIIFKVYSKNGQYMYLIFDMVKLCENISLLLIC